MRVKNGGRGRKCCCVLPAQDKWSETGDGIREEGRESIKSEDPTLSLPPLFYVSRAIGIDCREMALRSLLILQRKDSEEGCYPESRLLGRM